jgi:hypothetical protein
LVTLHSVPKHGAGLADDLFRGRLRYLNENWDFDAGTSVAKVQPVAVNVGTADDASCYGSNRNFDKDERAGSPAGPHMRGNFGHYFLDIIVTGLNVVSGLALECELARGIIECERTQLVDKQPLFRAAVSPNLDILEDGLLGR